MRTLVMLYGVLSYFIFFGAFVYFIAFVGDVVVPKTISSGPAMDLLPALMINTGLMLVWGAQHSLMARSRFKEAIASVVPQHTERSTYVLASSIVLIVLMLGWQPMTGIVWQIENSLWKELVWLIFAVGWVVALLSSFLTDHFDLFGLRQSWLYFVKKNYTSIGFSERLLYRWIRHPMMSGLLIAFWAIPVMDIGHLVFSVGMTVYIIIGISYEEKGLAKTIGSEYVGYQQRTSKVIPKVY